MQARRDSNIDGIDVSRYQGNINWSSVKAGGIAFAFIKASEGTGSTDPQFERNVTGAKAADVKVGFYHYAHPERNNAAAEAAHFISTINGYEADFPHVLDVEGDASAIGAAALTDWVDAWLKEVRKQTGHPVMIYSGASFARSYLGKELGDYPLWIAHYGVNTPMANSTWNRWAVFQYSQTGRVNGISGDVDLNVMERAFYDQFTTTPQEVEDVDATSPDTIKVVINDKLATHGRAIDGHVYAPLRQIGDATGNTVGWNNELKVPAFNGQQVDNFTVIDSTTYVPVRTAADLLGGNAFWHADTKKVYIYYKL
ncbi:lysozyme [Paenibacillus phyllosphaerae]|uniref:Lysozyme n=1 Tax=Paenibacillus phyllosphaerae TaxID=274593 RepID=A0A7W5B186_9BACL|nr:GH25 family lysozyme [Paenibacillus phyllosphaerae]MBB3112533.1 lysozyme [Paenibacillus phyllosphaerae]